mmetsp:Transcript_48686/g.73532  ORF Transcript_48686/g.73532 Transcript_48686/m.73532 type:complete len:114 (+) Transcript_48686:624-965(+)
MCYLRMEVNVCHEKHKKDYKCVPFFFLSTLVQGTLFGKRAHQELSKSDQLVCQFHMEHEIHWRKMYISNLISRVVSQAFFNNALCTSSPSTSLFSSSSITPHCNEILPQPTSL